MPAAPNLIAFANSIGTELGLDGGGEPGDIAQSAAVLCQLADNAFDASEWALARALYLRALQNATVTTEIQKCVLNIGRASLYLSDQAAAIAILEQHVEFYPRDHRALFYLGRAYYFTKRFFDALTCYTTAHHLDQKQPTYLIAVGTAAHALAFAGFGHAPEERNQSYFALAEETLNEAVKKHPKNIEAKASLMMFQLDAGLVDEAIELCQSLSEPLKDARERTRRNAVMNFAQALVRGGYGTRVFELKPLETLADGQKLLARARAMFEDRAPRTRKEQATTAGRRVIYYHAARAQWVRGEVRRPLAGGALARRAVIDGTDLSEAAEADYIILARGGHWSHTRALIAQLESLPDHFAGIAATAAATNAAGAEPVITDLVVRSRYWAEHLSTHSTPRDWASLVEQFVRRYRLYLTNSGEGPSATASLPVPDLQGGRILVLSRHGPLRLGGGEHFLARAAAAYAATGRFEVLFAGLTRDMSEAIQTWPDGGWASSEAILPDDPEMVRAFLVSQNVVAVHCISGLADFIQRACRGLNVKLVFGVHFWREFIASPVPSRSYYPYVGVESELKPIEVFDNALASFDYCYVNSDFCHDIAHQLYRWSAPVIYSAPGDPEIDRDENVRRSLLPPAQGTDYVLLPNCRGDKGWYLFLDIAAGLPHRLFVAVASQSDLAAALADLARRRLDNVVVLRRVDDMTGLYNDARVVLVPSFNFVETFSRVAVEAGRMGKPTFLADAGNLSYIGAGTSLLLPQDADVWIDRVERLFESDAYCREMANEATRAARAFDTQAVSIGVAGVAARMTGTSVLVCAGAGIGNVCHVTPMIAKLAAHYGNKVDVLLSADYPLTSAILGRSPHVASVFENHAHARYRNYDVVLVTHSFGPLIPDFNAAQVFCSRDFRKFDPGEAVHEAEFNLQFMRDALGIPYDARDVTQYFLGDWTYQPRPGERLRVGFHAGSKQGHWTNKRWPHFVELAALLQSIGAEVISVGLPEEYVEGTIDRTGLSLSRSIDELTTCDAVVSNDSGIMNIANALGIPLVSLFGPTNPVTRGPLKSRSVVIQPDIGCAPCEAHPDHSRRFKGGRCRCIALISARDVVQRIADSGILGRDDLDWERIGVAARRRDSSSEATAG